MHVGKGSRMTGTIQDDKYLELPFSWAFVSSRRKHAVGKGFLAFRCIRTTAAGRTAVHGTIQILYKSSRDGNLCVT